MDYSSIIAISGSAFTLLVAVIAWIQLRKQFPSETKASMTKMETRIALVESRLQEQITQVAVINSELENLKHQAEHMISTIDTINMRLSQPTHVFLKEDANE